MKIGYYICAKVGDSVIAISSLYAIKQYFPECKLYLFTNVIGKSFYQTFSWIDSIVLVDHLSHIPDYQLDFLISTDCTRKTKAKFRNIKCKIITFTKFHNFFNPQFKTTPLFLTPNIEARLLNLLKLIPNKKQAHLDLSQIPKITPPLPYQNKIKLFLKQNNPNKLKVLLVNPFGFSQSNNNIPLQAYSKFIENFIEDTCIIIPTFADKKEVIESNFPTTILKHPNFCIFHNNEDLLNVVELIRQVDLLFSIDTGLIHIANNVQTKAVILYTNEKMADKWGRRCTKCICMNQLKTQEIVEICTQAVYNLLHKF